MAWTTPRSWVTGEVVTATLLDQQIKGNMDLSAPAIMTTAGDIIYASGANTPARLAKDTNATRVLTNTGSSNVPAWAQVTLTSGVTGTLPVGNGGTGATTLTDGGVLLGNGTGAIVAMGVLADSAMIVGDGTTDPVAESGATLRTSIGIGTGDSPSVTGVTLSGALDANGTVDADVTDFDVLSSGDIDLVSSNDAAAAVYIAQSTGTSGTVKIHADTGTAAGEGASSVQITSDVGAVGVLSGLDAAGAIRLTADAGTSETIEIHADQGSGAASINLVSDAGGITLSASTGVIMPSQPCVLAYKAAHTSNGTGDGTVMTVDFTQEVFDQNADFASDTTFTAPVTGRYLVIASVQFANITAAASEVDIHCNAANRGSRFFQRNEMASDTGVYAEGVANGSEIVDMDASDTLTITFVVYGMGSEPVDIYGHSTYMNTFISVLLVA